MPTVATKPFFDSNVILYLLSDDARKADRAESLLSEEGLVSVQVLNEVASVARRKLAMSWPEVQDLLETVRAHCMVVDLTMQTHERGLQLARQFSFSLYDAMIVSAATLAGCTTLYSEDMQHGLIVAKRLRLVNPFAD
jgi:predicted nucleic acid-binding protein